MPRKQEQWRKLAVAVAVDVVMEPSVWGSLPDELLERILALLPLATIVDLRPTCRRFRSLLSSPSFLTLLRHPSRSQSAAFLLLSHPQFSSRFLPLYSAAADGWRSVSLAPSSDVASPSALLLSAASGLLCFALPPGSRPASLIVVNLLTSSTKILTLPTATTNSSSGTCTSAILISVPSDDPHGYKIFLPSACSGSSVFVYDSLARTWTRFPGHETLFGRGNSRQEGVLFDGALFFVTAEPFSLASFDLQNGEWDKSAVPGLPAELTFVRLVGTGGNRLYLVGGVGRNGISRSLKLWELVREKDGRRAWEEVGHLPELMCRKFVSVCYHNYAHVYCLWHEGMVCVCCTTWPEVLFYKVGRGTWHWLPKCPMLSEKWSCGFRWFSFVPDLYALV